MNNLDKQDLYDRLKILSDRLETQYNTLVNEAIKMDIDPSTIQDSSGSYLMSELLFVMADVFASMQELSQVIPERRSDSEDKVFCPRDGQSKEWHLAVAGQDSFGRPRTNGVFVGCDFGKE